jgi:uncharacterized protein
LGSVVPSYKPGVKLTDLASCLPDYAITAIREAIPMFDREIRGYAMADAILTGVETRTSTPVRVTRNEQFQSLNTPGLFPAGEGAGYAGGIMSAAIDGIRIAEAIAMSMTGGEIPRDRRHAGPNVQRATRAENSGEPDEGGRFDLLRLAHNQVVSRL